MSPNLNINCWVKKSSLRPQTPGFSVLHIFKVIQRSGKKFLELKKIVPLIIIYNIATPKPDYDQGLVGCIIGFDR